jgi:DAK2 domain fusion protein YloV
VSALTVLGPDDVRAVVGVFAAGLREHREVINRLNVYPVPDGDTGTNMALTVESVAAELAGAGPSMADVCRAIGHGSLMGARGNSGVILSQTLRGACAVLAEHDQIDAAGLAAALESASEAAYGAVMRPVEGTILTVVRASADAAIEHSARGGADLVALVETARAAAADALERTPEQLEVLAEAGVVDAGGTGYLLLLDALLHVVDGRPMPDPPELSGEPAHTSAAHGQIGHEHDHAHSGGGAGGGLADLRYEVMFLLDADDGSIDAFKDMWSTIGDSIVVVGGDGLYNCHIHTDDVGGSIEAAIDVGRPHRIRVTDLLEQVEEERWVREADPTPHEPAHAHEPVPTAVVSVSVGDGVRRIFQSLGVQRVVVGGQTMNPSTADLLDAVAAAPAEEVVILPNNKNIIPVAEQVGANTDKAVRVVPTRSVAEGFAALLAYDPQSSVDDNAKAMADAAGSVVAAEVTRAVRDSTCELGPIVEGDWLGLSRDGIVSLAPDLPTACEQLLGRLVGDGHELVTLIEGEGASPAVTRHLAVWLEEHRPGVETEVHPGGQPLYPYLFGIE